MTSEAQQTRPVQAASYRVLGLEPRRTVALRTAPSAYRPSVPVKGEDKCLCTICRPADRLLVMAYFLEYVTPHVVGRSTIDCGIFGDALTKAKRALEGLECIKAVLRYTPVAIPAFGEGVAIADFTASGGWRIHDGWDGPGSRHE